MSAPTVTREAGSIGRASTDEASLVQTNPDASKPRCGAKTKHGPCRRWPIKGGTCCYTHGGAIGRVKRAAARRIAAEEVRSLVGLLGTSEDIDPAAAMLREIQRCAGSVTLLAQVVDGLDTSEAELASPWVERLDAERDRLVRYSDLAVRAGLEHRRVRLAESMGNAVVGVLQAVLDQLELTVAQRQLAAQAMPTALRQLTMSVAS